jgi:hypothetical protein
MMQASEMNDILCLACGSKFRCKSKVDATHKRYCSCGEVQR